MLSLLEKIGLHRDCLRTRHFADYTIQPTLIWFPLISSAFVMGQDYLAAGHTTLCDPKSNDSIKTAEYVNSFCGSTLENFKIDSMLNIKHIPIVMLCQAVLLQLMHLGWDWVASETLLLDLQSFLAYSNDIVQSLDDWYTSIWVENWGNTVPKDAIDFNQANTQFLQSQLLVKIAKGWLIDWMVTRSDPLYRNFVLYSVLVSTVAILSGLLTLTFSIHNNGESSFICFVKNTNYQCVYRNGYLVYMISVANCAFCLGVILYIVYFNLRLAFVTPISKMFFCRNIPGMSSIDYKDSLVKCCRVSHRRQGLKLFSLYLDHNKFIMKQFAHLRRYAKLCQDKDVRSLKNTYFKYVHHVHKIRFLCATDSFQPG